MNGLTSPAASTSPAAAAADDDAAAAAASGAAGSPREGAKLVHGWTSTRDLSEVSAEE